jgi:hypothetical protein
MLIFDTQVTMAGCCLDGHMVIFLLLLLPIDGQYNGGGEGGKPPTRTTYTNKFQRHAILIATNHPELLF